MKALLDLSLHTHRRILGENESWCSHAYWKQHTSWRWWTFRVIADLLLLAVERDHCRQSFDRYH